MNQGLIQLSHPSPLAKSSKGAKNVLSDVDVYRKCLEMPEFRRRETKEKVIDEDDYLESLERIISRDYYPSVKGNEADALGEKGQIPSGLNVDSYLLNFTSDELESMKDIIEKDNVMKLKKRLWMYKEEVKSKANKERMLIGNGREDNQYGEIKAKNPLFFVPSHIEDVKLLGRKRGNDEGEDDFEDDNEAKKKIDNENTRFPLNFVEKMEEEHNTKVRKRLIELYESSDIVKLMKEMKENKVINGYTLIKDDTNKSTTSKQIPVVFTWGEIASTPIVIKETPNQFKVPETPQRETIANDLISKINFKKSESKSKACLANSSNQSSLTSGGLKLLNSIKRSNFLFNKPSPNRTNNSNSLLPKSQTRLSSIRVKRKAEDED